MHYYRTPHTAKYVAQAQAIRNEFIAKTLRSIFTLPSLQNLPRISMKSRKSTEPCVS